MKKLEEYTKLQKVLGEWKESFKPHCDQFKFKEYENVFSAIYTFEYIVEMIDSAIEEQEKSKVPKSYDVTVAEENETSKKVEVVEKIPAVPSFNRYMAKWETLDDTGLSSAERKEMNITFKDVLKLRYARYKGFIENIAKMIDSENIYY